MIEMPFSLFSNVSRRHSATAIILTLASAAVASFFVFQSSLVTQAAGIACPFVDGDGGTPGIQVTATVTIDDVDDGGGAVGDFYDCTAELVEIKTGVIVTLGSNIATGAIAEIHFLDLTIESGATISANVQGCESIVAGNGSGYGPDGSNVCTASTAGAGNYSNGSTSGGGHGGAGGSISGGAGGSTYDSATAPVLFGSSGGGGNSNTGGRGGGVVRLDVSGTFTHDGTITANGGTGTSVFQGAGGGSGGSVYVTTSVMNGTGTFSATGAAGGLVGSNGGGGGGGGRVAIEFASGAFSFDSGDFTMNGGAAGGGTNGSNPGAKGTVYVVDTQGTGPATDDDVTVFHGFTYTDTDYATNTWTIDPSATNQYCSTSGSATPSVTAGILTLDGILSCATTLASFNWAATSDFNVAASMTFTVSAANADVDWDIPAGNTQSWSGVTITTPHEGDFTIDDAVAITLTGSSAVNANAQWTALTSLTIDLGSSISANAKGCASIVVGNGSGYGPNGSNVCEPSTAGAGNYSNGSTSGGGHGGAGGSISGGAGGSTYGSATAPVLFGSSGGGGNSNTGGTGGGGIRLNVSGTLTLDGTISADGGTGTSVNQGAGGGSGGSIYVTASVLNGTTGAFSAAGASGGNAINNAAGGGGGGGRVAIEYTSGSFSFDNGDFSMAGGSAGTGGTNSPNPGAKGTVYVVDTQGTGPATDDDVTVFHGFTYTDTDYATSTWTIDSSATNQYCTSAVTPSVTAVDLTLAGTLSCSSGGLMSFVWTATTSFTVQDSTIWNVTTVASTLDFDIPDGDDQVWTNVTVNGGRAGFFTIDDAIAVTLAGTSAINANAQWTGLTDISIASTASINANTKGCAATTSAGFGPNGSNVCTSSTAGAGNASGGATTGGGHGGAGGSITGAAGGSTYDSATAPVLLGSSGGGNNGNTGGTAGGLVRLDVSGTFTHEGTLSADGATGTSVFQGAGGGSGGSIYVTAGSYTCSSPPDFSVAGAAGGLVGGNGGGGGGGGRIAAEYASVSAGCVFDADNDTINGDGAAIFAAGGAGGGGTNNAVAGSSGTLSLLQVLSMSSAVTDDTDGDGQIDTIVVTFSEDLDAATISGTLDFEVGGVATLTASETSAGVVTMTFTESGTADTDATPTVEIVGSIENAGNTKTATSGSIVSTDGADPLITSISPADGTTGVSSATDVVLTFSEPMDTGTVTVTVSSEPTGRTNTFSNGDETLTISYTGTFSSGDHTVTLTAGDDPEGNTNAGAVTGITHPATFTVASSGGGGSPTPPIGSGTPALDITSPEAGETLQASSPVQIAWTSQGRIDFVNLYSSLGGESWSSIVQNHPNSGLYDWTVPNHDTEALFLRIEGTDQTTVFVSDQEGPMSIVGATFEPPPPTEDGDVPVTVRGAQAFIRPNGCRYFATGVFFPSPKDGSLQPVNEICPGDRITTPSYRTVYLVNGLLVRHPFFNALMYRTHYADFTGVKVVTDSTLVTMDLGDLILPKPGTVLVKVPDRFETYALFPNPDDPLHHFARLVETEQAAIANFGPDWADSVIDIPPTMFDLLVLQTPILGQENIDSSTLLRREDLEDIPSPFTFTSILNKAARILLQAAKAVVTGW